MNYHKRDLSYDNEFPWQQQGNIMEEELSAKTAGSRPTDKKLPNGFGEILLSRTFGWYREVALWPMFILLLFELGIRVIQVKYLYLWDENIFTGIIFACRLVIFASLGITAIKNYQATKPQAMLAAALGGLVAGFLLAIFQLFWYLELWAIFNLIGQPLLMMVNGVIIVWFVGLFIKK